MAKFIEPTALEKPTSRLRKYKLTEMGRMRLAAKMGEAE